MPGLRHCKSSKQGMKQLYFHIVNALYNNFYPPAIFLAFMQFSGEELKSSEGRDENECKCKEQNRLD